MSIPSYKIILFSILFFMLTKPLLAQNEPFRGGNGDGFGFVGTTFNLSDVQYEGNTLTVTINQAAGQVDPTDQEPVLFTVVFSETVTDFDENDVLISGGGEPQTINVTGSGTTYTVELSDMTSNGIMIVEIPAGGAHNSVGNPNVASTSTDNSVTCTGLDLTVEIDLASGQSNLTNSSIVHFLVEFSEDVSDFENGDINISGTAGATTVAISGTGSIFDVAVSGMTNDGTVIISIPENVVHNAFGSGNLVSTNTHNTISCDYTRPSVVITYAPNQTSPSPAPVLRFSATFSELTESLQTSDILLGGTAGASFISVVQNGNVYTISVSGMTQSGTVIVSIDENAVNDLAGNGNLSSTNTQNEIEYDNILFTVEIEQDVNQNDPTNEDQAVFDIYFNREPADFDISDITITGNNSGSVNSLTGSGTTYQLTISNLTDDRIVIVSILANRIHDNFGNTNQASINTDNQVTVDRTAPGVVISLAGSQKSLTNQSTLFFNVVFSETIEGFDAEDVQLSGTTGANELSITGSGSNYQIVVSGMTNDGTVSITIPANVCNDMAGNQNTASVNSSNSITYDITKPTVEITQAPGQEDPTLILPLVFNVEFSETVVGFSVSSVNYGGSAGVTINVSGSGASYNVNVNGVQTNETFAISISSDVVNDLAGNSNVASVNTDNSITYIGTTAIDQPTASDDCTILCKEDRVYVSFEKIPSSKSIVRIFTVDGKLIYSKVNLDKENYFQLGKTSSVYLVHVINGENNTKSMVGPIQ